MSINNSLAKRFAELYLNGRWICGTNVNEVIHSVSFLEAIQKVQDLNSIADLSFHLSYYLGGVLEVLKGGNLNISDSKSFDIPIISTDDEWNEVSDKLTIRAEKIHEIIAMMSFDELQSDFSNGKYGSISRNIEGLIEHGYYHLGQMVLIRKMISKTKTSIKTKK